MGKAISDGSRADDLKIETDKRAARAIIVPRGAGFSVAAITGTMAAALGADSTVFAMRLDPTAPAPAWIERLTLAYTTIVAFTTPVTAGRRLELYRGSGAAAAAGTAIATAVRNDTVAGAASEFNSAGGGDMRISATAALTVAGITFEAVPFGVMPLVHVGAAGGEDSVVFEFPTPVVLQPGELLAIKNPVAMDAAGTWQLGVGVQWREAVAY